MNGSGIDGLVKPRKRRTDTPCNKTSLANAFNTPDFLKRVQAHAPFHIQKIRTDQGSEFRAFTVQEYLTRY